MNHPRNISHALTVLAAAILLSGCSLSWQDTEPEAPAQKVQPESRATPVPFRRPAPVFNTRDIAIGEAAGAERREKLLATDSITDDDLGYFMDVLDARLRQVFVDTDVKVQRKREGFLITLPGSITFGSNSTRLMGPMESRLQSLSQVLTEFHQTIILVHGHTDDRGDSTYNLGLSRERAVTVADFLVAQDIPAQRLVAIAHGEEEPRADNATAEGRAMNRRIEIEINALLKKNEAGVGVPAGLTESRQPSRGNEPPDGSL